MVIKGTTTCPTSNFDGNCEISIDNFPATLIFTSLGYAPKEMGVTGPISLNVPLDESATGLEEVVLLGNRSKTRIVIGSSVPIDNIGVAELKSTGQPTIDKILTYKVLSFNSNPQAISDGTAYFDPADLRRLGPSRTLVLVNDKCKNLSALVYINDTSGKGEVGIDLRSSNRLDELVMDRAGDNRVIQFTIPQNEGQ